MENIIFPGESERISIVQNRLEPVLTSWKARQYVTDHQILLKIASKEL